MHKTKERSAVMVELVWFILGKSEVCRIIHAGPCDSCLNADCWCLSIFAPLLDLSSMIVVA